ncbi:MAG: hypothetical protein RJA70_1187 [Pseudomonadota bacterium]|jgi:hypothetical protein
MFQPAFESPPSENFLLAPPVYSHRATASYPCSTLRHAIELGEQIQRLLDSSRNAADPSAVSLKGLARQMRLPVPMSTLWRALAIYRWNCRDPEIAHCRHLRVGHLSALLGVDPVHRLALLRAAEHQRWSRRELQTRAASLKSGSREPWPDEQHSQAAPLPPIAPADNFRSLTQASQSQSR